MALREQLIKVDPTLKLLSANQPLRVPQVLSEAQVEALLGAPDHRHAHAACAIRTMLELMSPAACA